MDRVGLIEVREAMGTYAASFDPALISPADAAAVVDEACLIEKMAATVKALAGARLAESGLWKAGGAKSAAHDLALRSGTSVGAAADALATGKALAKLAALDGAARRGEVSAQQAAAIADAAGADPAAESRLVAKAGRCSLGELRQECLRTKAAARPDDADERHNQIRRNRFLRSFTDAEGAWNLSVRNVAEVGAELLAVLRPIQDQLFRRARAEGRRESYEAYAADALAELVRIVAGGGEEAEAGEEAEDGDPPGADQDEADATGPEAPGSGDGRAEGSAGGKAAGTGAGEGSTSEGSVGATATEGGGEASEKAQANDGKTRANDSKAPGGASGAGNARPLPRLRRRRRPGRSVVPAKIIVRIDWDALVRGWPGGGEVCEIAGVGPVPVSVVRAMVDSGNPFLAAVVTKGADVVNVAHLGRSPTARQLTALQWRDPVCVVSGCNGVAGLEVDHRRDWARTRVTLLGWLDRLCGHHHDLKTTDGWALVEGSGKRPMVAPDDPRHPRRRPPPADAGAAGTGTGASAPRAA